LQRMQFEETNLMNCLMVILVFTALGCHSHPTPKTDCRQLQTGAHPDL